MSATTHKSKIGLEDIKWRDGQGSTFTRLTSTGSEITLHKVGNEIDALSVYGGGTVYTDVTIAEAQSKANEGGETAVITLAYGTWTISNNLTISGHTLKVPRGVTISVDSGVTLTLDDIEAGSYQIFSGSGTVTFSSTNQFPLDAAWWSDLSTCASNLNSNASATNRHTVIFSGIYNEAVTMQEYVDIVGISREASRITQTSGTGVTAADNCILANLTIEAHIGIDVVVATTDFNIDSIHCITTQDGLYFSNSSNSRVVNVHNSFFEGDKDIITVGDDNVTAKFFNCYLKENVGDTYVTGITVSGASCDISFNGGSIDIENTVNNDVICVNASDSTVRINDTRMKAYSSNGTPNVYGVRISGTSPTMHVIGGSALASGGGTNADLKNASTSGTLGVKETYYLTTSGTITFLGESSVRAYQDSSTNQDLGGVAYTKITLDTESWDTQGEFDSTTNYRFTATQAGKYLVTAHVGLTLASPTGNLFIAVYKNGAIHSSIGWQYHTQNTTYTGIGGSCIIPLEADDYIELYAYNGTANMIIFCNASNDTWMEVQKL